MRKKIQIARLLRQQQTTAEAVLWKYLRNRNFERIKFRRQHPLKNYIVDFIALEHQLIIELDGGYHNNPKQKEKDELRDLHLSNLGYTVLRFENNMVFHQLELLLSGIKKALKNKKSLPLPVGEGRGEGTTILSTKKLTPAQKELVLNSGLSIVEYNAIQIDLVTDVTPPLAIENAIFTSKNAVKAILNSEFRIQNCYCVGSKTEKLLKANGFQVIATGIDATDLAHNIIKHHPNKTFDFFCGDQRRPELPMLLAQHQIHVTEHVVYHMQHVTKAFDRTFDGILFFSPSAVQSYMSANTLEMQTAFCIGNTTASEAKKHTKNVVVANKATIENVIVQAIKHCKF